LNLGLKVLIRLQELPLLGNWQLSEHTRDPRSLILANELLDVVMDTLVDLSLEIRVDLRGLQLVLLLDSRRLVHNVATAVLLLWNGNSSAKITVRLR
jgi:hypothetical protein